MSELFQLLVVMAVPAAFLLLCRHLNLRGRQDPPSRDRTVRIARRWGVR